ncbi:MAG: CheR family methyltransferase [Actinomycetota bacterium]
MNELLLQQFIELIATYTGLQMRPQDREALCQKIWARVRTLKLSSPERYYQLLGMPNPESQTEWRELILHLTTTESYFLRDRGQFSLLKNLILPELISLKNHLHNSVGLPRMLRLWSAGCSTGEEPYSLAILLRELLPDWEQWNLLILGTDINEEALEKAKGGIYSDWSFRLVDAQLQNQYFYQSKNGWKIAEHLRSSVTFRTGNLVKDEIPNFSNDIYNMDLIICRNVFVYFHSKFISLVLKKFYNTLQPGGYLITGHAELYGQDLDLFRAKVFPESVIYQRRNPEEIQPDLPPVNNREEAKLLNNNAPERSISFVSAAPPASPVTVKPKPGAAALSSPLIVKKFESDSSPNALLKEAETCFRDKAYTEAIQKAEQAIQLSPHNFDAYYLLAQVHANIGKYDQAIRHCKLASEIDSLSIFPYYLLAHIYEEKGDLEQAKNWLKRIIYLSPYSISAYLKMGDVYEVEGDLMRAKKMYRAAWDLLKKLPPNATLENHQGKITAIDLMTYVERALKKLSIHSS